MELMTHLTRRLGVVCIRLRRDSGHVNLRDVSVFNWNLFTFVNSSAFTWGLTLDLLVYVYVGLDVGLVSLQVGFVCLHVRLGSGHVCHWLVFGRCLSSPWS